MPQPHPPDKTGPDYSRILSNLTQAGLQKDNPALYQAIKMLVDGTRTFQGYIHQRFNDTVQGSHANEVLNLRDVIDELIDRQNTKYAVSLTNSSNQTILPNTNTILTFNFPIFDDGLMFDGVSSITLNDNAQWLVSGRVAVCAPNGGFFKIAVNLNGIEQFATAIFVPTS